MVQVLSKTYTPRRNSNPAHGSGRMDQVLSKTNTPFEEIRIPPTGVGGWIKSFLKHIPPEEIRIPPTGVGGWFKSSLQTRPNTSSNPAHGSGRILQAWTIYLVHK